MLKDASAYTDYDDMQLCLRQKNMVIQIKKIDLKLRAAEHSLSAAHGITFDCPKDFITFVVRKKLISKQSVGPWYIMNNITWRTRIGEKCKDEQIKRQGKRGRGSGKNERGEGEWHVREKNI